MLTLRDVYRVLNTLHFRLSVLCKEISIEDVIGLTTIEVLEPELFKWIAENKNLLCGETNIYRMFQPKDEGNRREKYEREFQRKGIDAKNAVRSVAALFPLFATTVGYRFYEKENETNIRKNMRVALPERFDLFFWFDPDTIKVSRLEINRFIYSADEQTMGEMILEIYRQGNMNYFINELMSLVDSIPQNRLVMMISVFVNSQYVLEDRSNHTIFSIPIRVHSSRLVDELIRKIDSKEERFCAFQRLIQNSDEESLGTIAYKLRIIEKAYGRYSKGSDEMKRDQIITLAQLEGLECAFLERAEAIATKTFLEKEDCIHALILWDYLDKKSAQSFLMQSFSDVVCKLKYVCNNCGHWIGTNGEGWVFNQALFPDYLTEEKIIKDILEFDTSSLDCFSEEELIKLGSFVLNYTNQSLDHVDISQAKDFVEKWKYTGNI